MAALWQLNGYSGEGNELTNLEKMAINQTAPQQGEQSQPASTFTSSPMGVGRNDPCPCGSGKNLRSAVCTDNTNSSYAADNSLSCLNEAFSPAI